MKIKSVEHYIINLELKRPYTIAYKTVTEVENVIVVVTLDNGVKGVGTANPSRYVVGDDVNDTFLALGKWDKDLLLKQDIGDFYNCLHQVHTSLADHIGARAALDIALHDAFSRQLDKPLVRFFGQRIDRLPTSITIGIKNVAETLYEAEEYIGRGFSFIKVKLGKSLDEDIERITKLREQYGSRIHIRIDANQGYSAEETIQLYERTRHLDLELIEQPLPVKDSPALKELPQPIRDLIAADEALVDAEDAFALSVPPASCGIFNIKLMKCGGILPAQHISTIGRATGRKLMWGCNDESMISIAAALHVALSCPDTRYLDLDGSLDLAKDIATGTFVVKDGMMSVSDRPGLGWENLQVAG